MPQTFVEIQFTGIEALAGTFERLSATMQNRILRDALRPAAKAIAENVRRGTPVGPASYWKGPKGKSKEHHGGALRKSIRVRAAKRSRTSVGMVVTTSDSDNLFQGDQFYGGFVEFGHFQGKRKRTRPSRGDRTAWSDAWNAGIDPTGAGRTKFVPGEHFMQHGAEEMIPTVARMIETSITGAIDAIARGDAA